MAFITLNQLTKAIKGLVNKINLENNVTNSKIGILSDLNTTTKDNLVAAVNEVKSSAIISETDPTVPSWAKQSTKPTYTAAEVGALPDTYTAPVTSVNGQTGAITLSIPAATTVTNTLASGTLIATINGTNIYAPAYVDADGVSY